MILAHGGKFGGYGLMFRDGRPQFLYNFLGLRETIVASTSAVPIGRHTIRAVFRKSGAPDFARGRGAPGTLGLYVDGQEVARGTLDPTAPVMLNFSGTLTCGYHHMEPFNSSYGGRSRSAGRSTW